MSGLSQEERLAAELSEYAHTRAKLRTATPAKRGPLLERLADLVGRVASAEKACGVGRTPEAGQSLGELVARPEFGALLVQLRGGMSPREAYRLHSLTRPEPASRAVLEA